MGLQKYRTDTHRQQKDGAVVWCSDWLGGPSLARVDNCRLITMSGDMRRTVYVTGDADTWFSIPAACIVSGVTVRGYLTEDGDGNLVFHHIYY